MRVWEHNNQHPCGKWLKRDAKIGGTPKAEICLVHSPFDQSIALTFLPERLNCLCLLPAVLCPLGGTDRTEALCCILPVPVCRTCTSHLEEVLEEQHIKKSKDKKKLIQMRLISGNLVTSPRTEAIINPGIKPQCLQVGSCVLSTLIVVWNVL